MSIIDWSPVLNTGKAMMVNPTILSLLQQRFSRMLSITTRAGVLLASALLCMNQVLADDAMIVDAKILPAGGERTFQIHVTIKHADTGWDHYANRWDVLDQEGNVLGSRTLHHPHVDEQPFTRSLTLVIPAGISQVTIVAADSVHGDNEETFALAVPE